MTHLSAVTRGLAVALGGLAASCVLAVPAARAASVPFTDPSAQGSITLCDAHGRAITSGSVAAKPFVPKAVGSVAAPSPYDAPGSRAVMYAFIPRKGVDPTLWNGEALTASSTYDNPAHPSVAATSKDPSLAHFTRTFVLGWNGLMQLRMYYSRPLYPDIESPYAATTIQVHGTTWSVVGPAGTAPCSASTAASVEHPGNLSGLPGAVGTTQLPVKPAVAASSTPSAGPTSSSALPASAGPGPATASQSPDVAGAVAGDAAAAASPESASVPGLLVGLPVLVVAVLGGTWWWRRSASRPQPRHERPR